MKEETKNKLKKIVKIGGFVITFGFAVFGVLCAAMLIANGSGKKDDIKTLDSSLVQNEVRSERNIKPRKADENNVYLISEVGYGGEHIAVENLHTFKAGASVAWSVYGLNPNVSSLPFGYYVANVNQGGSFNLLSGGADSWVSFSNAVAVRDREGFALFSWEGDNLQIVGSSLEETYFYYDGTKNLYFEYFGDLVIRLVDTLEVSSEDILELPNNWSPLRMVAKNVNKENNLIFGTDWNYWTDVPQANGQPMLDLSTILFRNQGRVYNHIYIYFKNLNGLKYATNSENIGTGASTDWCADRVEYALVLDDSLKYNYLASSVGTSILQGENVFNLGLNWSNPSARKLEILDKRYPSNTAIGNTLLGRFPRNGTNSLDPVTGQTIRPFGFGVWDYEYLLEYSNVSSIDFVLGGSSDVFALLTGAFNGLLPIFNVQILPNITLGILLFLPLIGGIIVIIIRVIKK